MHKEDGASATPSTVLTVTVIEADGDTVSRANGAGAYADSEELFRPHREAVKYATGAWRRRLQEIRELVHLGANVYRELLPVSIGSLIRSAATWSLDGVLKTACLGLSVLSFLSSTSFSRFNQSQCMDLGSLVAAMDRRPVPAQLHRLKRRLLVL